MNDYQRYSGTRNSSGTNYGLTVNWIHLLIGGALCYFRLLENLAFHEFTVVKKPQSQQ